MAFTALLGTGIASSSLRGQLVFGLQPTVPIVPPLQPRPIVPLRLDSSQDFPILIVPRGM